MLRGDKNIKAPSNKKRQFTVSKFQVNNMFFFSRWKLERLETVGTVHKIL